MKIFSYFGAVVLAVVIFIFTEKLEAAKISHLTEMAEVEKLVASQTYQELEEAIIMSSSDKDSQAAKSAIEDIRNEVSKQQINVDSQKAINYVMGPVLTAVRTVSTAERLANIAFDEAKNLTVQDPKAATEGVQNSMKSIKDFIMTCGVPIEDIFGSALSLACGSNHRGLKKAMSCMQNAGTSIFSSLKIAEQLTTKGIEAGGSAAEQGFKAARETVGTGGSAAFNHHRLAAKHIIEGYMNPDSNLANQTNCVAGILESLTSNVSTDDPDALAAINSLNKGLKSIYPMLNKQSVKDAATIMNQALVSTILETADAMAVAKKALKEAAKLPSEDTKAAIAAVHNGMEVAKNEVTHGSSIGFLGYGAARQIAGGMTIDGLIPSMVDIIIARYATYDDLKLAEEAALMGIRGGAGAQGIDAAIQICKAAGNALFIQVLESGIMGLKVFLDL